MGFIKFVQKKKQIEILDAFWWSSCFVMFFPQGRVVLHSVSKVSPLPETLLKHLAKNLIKNLAKNLVRNLANNMAKNP